MLVNMKMGKQRLHQLILHWPESCSCIRVRDMYNGCSECFASLQHLVIGNSFYGYLLTLSPNSFLCDFSICPVAMCTFWYLQCATYRFSQFSHSFLKTHPLILMVFSTILGVECTKDQFFILTGLLVFI